MKQAKQRVTLSRQGYVQHRERQPRFLPERKWTKRNMAIIRNLLHLKHPAIPINVNDVPINFSGVPKPKMLARRAFCSAES